MEYTYLHVSAVNIYRGKFDLYIGRSRRNEPRNKWSNPSILNDESQREQVVHEHLIHLLNQIYNGEITVEELLALQGKVLGCFCYPKLCHAVNFDKLIHYLITNTITNQEQMIIHMNDLLTQNKESALTQL